MTDTKPRLTGPQERALRIIIDFQYENGRTPSPRQVARRMWPDSIGWSKRTNPRGGRSGAVGGTMPMKAATILWRLHRMGYAYMLDEYGWAATYAGRRAIQAIDDAAGGA